MDFLLCHTIQNRLTHGPLSDVLYSVIFKPMLGIKFMSDPCEIDFKWMTQNNLDDK